MVAFRRALSYRARVYGEAHMRRESLHTALRLRTRVILGPSQTLGIKLPAANMLDAVDSDCTWHAPTFMAIQCVGVRGQNHMSDRSRQSVARCWGVC